MNPTIPPRRIGAPIRKTLAALAACSVGVLSLPRAGAAQLIENGSFDQVLVHWSVPEPFEPWIPYQTSRGDITLHPNSEGYTGDIVCQPLNVTGIAGQTVDAAIDLSVPWSPPAGHTACVVLEYLDDGGALQEQAIIQPDNASLTDAPATFTGSYTFPPTAEKLVRLKVQKMGDGQVYADNVSLTSTTLVPGPIPQLGALEPGAAYYGQTCVLRGSHLAGSTPPVVRLNGSTEGIALVSHDDTTVTFVVDAPATSGKVSVEIDGTVPCGRRHLDILSPHYTLEHSQTSYHAVPGQVLRIDAGVIFHNGYTPPAGGLPLQVLNGGVPFPGAVIGPNPVPGHGGATIALDTTGLAEGKHPMQLRGDPAGVAVDSFFDVFVELPDDLGLFVYDESWNFVPAPSPLVIDGGEPYAFTPQLLDSGGEVLKADPPIQWSSGGSSFFEVFVDSSPWGGPQIIPKQTGSGTLTATGPGGAVWTFPVEVQMPTGSPKVVACMMSPAFLDNSGNSEGALIFETDSVMSGSVSYGVSAMTPGPEFLDIVRNPANTGFTGTFRVAAGTPPGEYLFHADGGGVRGHAILTVVADPLSATVGGRVVDLRFPGPSMHDETSGMLEFIDAASGDVVQSHDIWSWGDSYLAATVPPGDYKVRYSSFPSMGAPPPPQYWSQTGDPGEAGILHVAAGDWIDGIDFYFVRDGGVTPPIPLGGPPVLDQAAGSFSIPIQTEVGTNYLLRKSYTGEDGSWFTVGDMIWGDGGVQSAVDPQADAGRALYRVHSE